MDTELCHKHNLNMKQCGKRLFIEQEITKKKSLFKRCSLNEQGLTYLN